jgi:hypothetical protein
MRSRAEGDSLLTGERQSWGSLCRQNALISDIDRVWYVNHLYTSGSLASQFPESMSETLRICLVDFTSLSSLPLYLTLHVLVLISYGLVAK